jgi:D-alanyl-D-alanine carboxypeptidase
MKIRRTRTLIGIGLSSVLLMGAGAGTPMAQPTAVLTEKSSVSSINKKQTMSAADKAAIDAAAAAAISASPDAAPGLWVAVWDPKKGYYEQAYGNAVLPGTPATRADHFRIGSITKTVFATAVLEQVAARKLALTDTVKKLDPVLAKKFPTIGKNTVAQLLSMKTQIPDYAEAAVDALVADSQKRFTREGLIALGLEKGKPLPSIGGYSTTNYIILGLIMQKLTGKTPEVLINGVFAQAGMTQSALPGPSKTMPAPAAHGYVGNIYGEQFAKLNPAVIATTDVTDWAFYWGREGGGAYSTIGDLATWGGTCLGNSLLPKSTVAKRLVFSSIDVGQYGRGIIKEDDWLSHEGQAIGYEANVSCNPKTGAVTAWAVNSTEGSLFLNDAIGPVAFPDYYAALQAQ